MEDSVKKKQSNLKAFGIIGLVLGSFSLIFALIPCIGSYAMIPSGIATIFCLLSFLGLKQLKKPYGMSLAGLIIAIIALVFSINQYLAYKQVFDMKNEFDQAIDNAIEETVIRAMEEAGDTITILEPDTTEIIENIADSTNAIEEDY